MTNADTQKETMNVETKVKVIVHYPPAAGPFKDEAHRSETIGHFKPRVLTAFGLVEGQLPDGNTVTYTLFHHKDPLENANQTLDELAGEHKELTLKLAQQITQGA